MSPADNVAKDFCHDIRRSTNLLLPLLLISKMGMLMDYVLSLCCEQSIVHLYSSW